MKPSRVPRSKQPRASEPRASLGRWLASCALLVILAAAGIAFWRARQQPAENLDAPAVPRSAIAPPPPIAASRYRNTQSEAKYVGTERCADCHTDQHASYLHTAHSRSMSVVDPTSEPEGGAFDHQASGRRYRAYRKDGTLRHRESLALPAGVELELCDYPLKYLIGSGRFARTYAIEDRGFLVESPLTWYASLEKWAMSPGYDRPGHRAFHRVVEHDCLFCHAGNLESIDNNEQRVHVRETAIGCERCHGPGSLHVAKWSAAADEMGPEGDLTIVNPRRLPRELAESVCHQCHLTSETQVAVRGRKPSDFRPGLRWQDFAIDYGFEAGSQGMTVVGHVAQMRQSKCYQGSETLTCLTCHDPHAALAPAELTARHRATCTTCHAEPSCGLALAERTSRNDNDCAACHMPQSETDIPHIAFTHHRIGIHEPASAPKATAEQGFRKLTPLLDIAELPEIDRRLSLGLAYVQYYRDHAHADGSEAYLAAARPLIQEATAQGVAGARLALAQAELAGAAGDIPAARRWAEKVLATEGASANVRTPALRLLAGFALQEGRLAEAQSYLEELTALRRDPPDWFLIGVCHQRQGHAAEAIAAFERVLEIDPAQPETYEILAPLYRDAGNAEREAWCRQRAKLIQQASNSLAVP